MVLPIDVSGKAVLDLSCDQGFYCIEAKRRGAARVLGLDPSAANIEIATRDAAAEKLDIEFRVAAATPNPVERSDIVLLLSALHLVGQPKALLRQIHSLLAPHGLLILQCGLNNFPNRQLQRFIGEVGEFWIPSRPLLIDDWLEPFVARYMGKSTLRGSESLGATVFHCSAIKPTVVFVSGGGSIGKTSVTRHFKDAVVITTVSLASVAISADAKPAPEQQIFGTAIETFRGHVGRAWDSVKSDASITNYFAQTVSTLIRALSPTKLIVVEGYALADLATQIMDNLKEDFIVWNLTRASQRLQTEGKRPR